MHTTPPAAPQPTECRDQDVEQVALDLLEATLARARGLPVSCWPEGEARLLTAAHDLTQHAAGDRSDASGGRWHDACRAYVRTLGDASDLWAWPTVTALSLSSRLMLEKVAYPAPVASLRERDAYRLVDVDELPAPVNPFRCRHWETFTAEVDESSLGAVMRKTCGWPGRLASRLGVGAGARRVGSLELDPARNARNTETPEAFVEWLHVTGRPPCAWHDRPGGVDVDWLQAAALARQCWEDVDVEWSGRGIEEWMETNAPADLRLPARSLLTDPVVWGGNRSWKLGNGQTRYLALVGAGASHILVVTG